MHVLVGSGVVQLDAWRCSCVVEQLGCGGAGISVVCLFQGRAIILRIA